MVKIDKTEWDEFQKWKKSSVAPSQGFVVAPKTNDAIAETFEIEDNHLPEPKLPKQEPYVCGNCGHSENEEFNPCPQCNKEVEW